LVINTEAVNKKHCLSRCYVAYPLQISMLSHYRSYKTVVNRSQPPIVDQLQKTPFC